MKYQSLKANKCIKFQPLMKYNLKFQKWKHVHNLDFYTDLKHLYTVSSKCKRKYRQGTMTFGPPRTHTRTHTHNGSSYHPMLTHIYPTLRTLS